MVGKLDPPVDCLYDTIVQEVYSERFSGQCQSTVPHDASQMTTFTHACGYSN
jgi:hypothetical protein